MLPNSSDAIDISPYSTLGANLAADPSTPGQGNAAIEAARKLIASLPDSALHQPGSVSTPHDTPAAPAAAPYQPAASTVIMPGVSQQVHQSEVQLPTLLPTPLPQPLHTPSVATSQLPPAPTPQVMPNPPQAAATSTTAPTAAFELPQLGAVATPLAPPVLASPVVVPTTPKATAFRKGGSSTPSRIMPIAIAVGSFLLLLVLFRSQVIFSQITYLTSKKSDPITTAAPAAAVEAVPAGSVLNIPKINVSAPIIFATSNEEALFQKDLEKGVVHYANTASPGQPGNSVIFGHSSNDWWEPGNYKFVFVLLDKLVVGDTFSVNYDQKKYVYQVTIVKVVEPTDLSVLNPTTDPSMTIITCTPPGTSWKRLVVQAKQISPVPGSTEVTAPKPTATAKAILPGNAPSFFDQITSFWNSLIGKK